MKPVWQRYWREQRMYLRYLLAGPLLALFFFLLNYPVWLQPGERKQAFLSVAIYGVIVPLTIWTAFASAYALRVAVSLGHSFRDSLWFRFVVGTLGAGCGMWLSAMVSSLVTGEPVHFNGFLWSLIVSQLLMAAWLFYRALREAREEKLALQAAVAEARYQMLEQQMRPHFLFNALNSLAELIESKQENAAVVAHTLAELYRKILTNSKTKTASLQSELELARAYLELEQLRFGARLRFEFAVSNEAAHVYVPSLTIQTLVENAVKHGITKSVAGGFVNITVKRNDDDWYQLSVRNSGASPLLNGTEPSGIGLANTRARLDLLYGNRHGFQLRQDGADTIASFLFTGEKVD